MSLNRIPHTTAQHNLIFTSCDFPKKGIQPIDIMLMDEDDASDFDVNDIPGHDAVLDEFDPESIFRCTSPGSRNCSGVSDTVAAHRGINSSDAIPGARIQGDAARSYPDTVHTTPSACHQNPTPSRVITFYCYKSSPRSNKSVGLRELLHLLSPLHVK